MSSFLVINKLLACILVGTTLASSKDCISRDYGNGGTVCVCNEQHCDTISPPKQVLSNQYLVYTSNKAGDRFKKQLFNLKSRSTTINTQFNVPFYDKVCDKKEFREYHTCGESNQNGFNEWIPYYLGTNRTNIFIDPNIRFQEIIGFGGAFTDSTGINIKEMSPALQDILLRSFFSNTGIEYSMGRIPIGGTDFSVRKYSYVDSDDKELNCVDPLLRNFKLVNEDLNFKIPLIQKAMRLTKNPLLLIASLWIAPKAMKENNDYGGTMGFIKKPLYQLYANYFVKFLDQYLNYGIPFWGITTGNEPFTTMISVEVNIPGVLWVADELGIWTRDYLGPAIANSSHNNIKILVLDDQRPLLLHVLPKILADKKTQNLVKGICIHWYFNFNNNTNLLDKTHELYPDKFLLSTEASADKKTLDFIQGIAIHWYFSSDYDNKFLDKIHELYPQKFILGTEACAGDDTQDVKLGAWDRGERYAHDIIQDILHWVVGWIDWNMVLDTKGGPTIASAVDATIIANKTEFYKQPQYYALGHFSKFVPRGSYRIFSSQCDEDDLVDVVAFQKPDNGIVVVLLNRNNFTIARSLINADRNNIDISLTPHSITTVLYW